MDTKKLKQKILDLAIHGKLVPQDPNDEPASVLLERIRAEKERLIKEGKIKKSKKSAPSSDMSHYGEEPFEVPQGWCWVTLGEIGEIITGSTPSKDVSEYYGGNIPFYKPTDLEQGIKTNTASDTLTLLGYNQARKLPEGSVLVTCIGATIGKTGLITAEGACNQQINAIIPSNCVISSFLYYSCISGYMHNEIRTNASATTLPILNKNNFAKLLIPIPPLNEQKRIVGEIERLTSLIDSIENSKEGIQALIKTAKNKILDLAIHGKLVPQDPTDEPASELLKRINSKAVPATDNAHNKNLPNGWINIEMKHLIKIISGVSYKKEDIVSSGIRILRGGNIQDGQILLCEDDVYIDTKYANDENSVFKNDIVLVASTGSSLLIGKTGFANETFQDTQIGAFLRILRPNISETAKYINLIFSSEYYRGYIRSLAKGTNINNVKNAHIENFTINFPPISEQHRIVAKVEELFAQLDRIESSLQAQSGAQRCSFPCVSPSGSKCTQVAQGTIWRSLPRL